ncbi:MAG: hydrogenase iron-sulfur subunit [Deltaproteobacteria bacterium]|nr:hydrogenase iron-sulfur subunit [Deltaproteobacteria bacterium]
MEERTPKIVCFSCSFGWGYLGDRNALGASIEHWIPVACSGKVDATHILKSFQGGADAVLILGCPEGECHFQDGNYQTKKKLILLRQVLAAHGIEPERLKMVLAVDPAGARAAAEVEALASEVRALGPVRVRAPIAATVAAGP